MSFKKKVQIKGPTSVQIQSSQDGNGRMQRTWNATFGVNKRYMTDNEPAFFENLSIVNDPYYSLNYAPNGRVNNIINWRTHLEISQNGDVKTYGNLSAQNYTGELSGSLINSKCKNAIVTIYASSGADTWLGSGAFVKINNTYGYVLTAAHVVLSTELRDPKAENLWINVSNYNNTGKHRMIRVSEKMFVDNTADVAIFFVPGITNQQTHLDFADYSTVQNGDLAYLFGNPLGFDGQSISMGAVRDTGFVDCYGYLLMKNITLSTPGLPGNSGSPILNKDGDIIGLFSWGISGAETVGGGLNGEMVKLVAEKLLSIQGDYITKRFLGLSWITVPTMFNYSSYFGFVNNDYDASGICVLGLLGGSPFLGTLNPGSVLLSMTIDGKKYTFNDNESTTPSEVSHMISSNKTVQIEYKLSVWGSVQTRNINLNADYSGGNASTDMFIGGYSTKDGSPLRQSYKTPFRTSKK